MMNEFAKDLMKYSAINLASGIAGVVGMFGGLLIVGTIIEKHSKKKA